MAKVYTLDIEFYDKKPGGKWQHKVWEQGYFLVHGSDDVLWTDDVEAAIQYMADQIMRVAEEEGLLGEAGKMGKAVEEEMIECGILVSSHAKEVFDAWEKNGMLDELKRRLNKDLYDAAARSVEWCELEDATGAVGTVKNGFKDTLEGNWCSVLRAAKAILESMGRTLLGNKIDLAKESNMVHPVLHNDLNNLYKALVKAGVYEEHAVDPDPEDFC